MIRATLYTDAACPWAYSANPALRVLEWRYGAELDWRLVMIGLRDRVSEAAAAAHDPTRPLVKRYSALRAPLRDAVRGRHEGTPLRHLTAPAAR